MFINFKVNNYVMYYKLIMYSFSRTMPKIVKENSKRLNVGSATGMGKFLPTGGGGVGPNDNHIAHFPRRERLFGSQAVDRIGEGCFYRLENDRRQRYQQGEGSRLPEDQPTDLNAIGEIL